MKKILALLFVCAGLTAMAVNPHVNTNAKVVAGQPNKAMVMKTTSLANQFSAPAMNSGNFKSLQQFFAEKNVTPADNRLMKKAPRRVGDDEVLDTKLAFMVGYDYDSTSNAFDVLAPNRYVGGWTVEMEKAEENVFNAYLFFTGIPFQFIVDYENGTAEMVMETLGGWQWSDTTTSGRYTYYNDTTEYLFLWNEDYLLDESEDAEPTNLQGTLYEDGTIYIPGGWCVYLYQKTKRTQVRNGVVQSVDSNTVSGMYTDMYKYTYLMLPNAKHDYDYQGNGTTTTHYDNLAYMFQDNENDSLVYVWNLWEFGGRGVEFNLDGNGGLTFPSGQIVGCGDVDDLEEAYAQYDWQTYGHWFINADAEGNDDVDQAGTYTTNSLNWDATTWLRYCLYGEDMYALSYYPMLNNVVTYTDGEVFLFGKTADPIIVTQTTDEAVIVDLELEENAEYLLLVGDEFVEAPYSLERGAEDYTVTVAAMAQVPGKHESEIVSVEVTVPALAPAYTRGDVDMDGSIGISDVTRLVDYILTKDATTPPMSLEAADTDLDGGIGIADVTKLVDYILSKSWD